MTIRSRRLRLTAARGTAILLGAAAVCGLGVLAWASADDPDALSSGTYPAAYAITGAKIVAAPGRVFEPGTIVVRRGVVESVGLSKDVETPYDAEPIDGKGLVVYPGFLDLDTTIGQRAGVERSATGHGRPVDLADAPLPATPPDNRKGLTPEFEVASSLDLTDSVVEPRRRLGFTALLSAPAGAIATGQSALISTGGLPRREAILKSPVALHVQLAPPTDPAPAAAAGPPGMIPGQGRRRGFGLAQGPGENPYPRVLMGSVAHFRQAMLDAEHQARHQAHYEARGGVHPPYDPALEVLAAARARKIPVWWEANTRDEIHRALDLAEEFGTTAVITGGREAAKVVARLKATQTPVVLRLDFPEEPKIPTVAEYRKRPAAERDVPRRVLEDRKQKWDERVGTAAVLVKAGVPIAFASEGMERVESLPTAIRQMIAQGLTADQALEALTKGAAAIAMVDARLGSLEPGKLGHLVAMTAPFTDEKAKVKYVLVDGLKFEIKPETGGPRGGRNRPGGGPGGSGGLADADSFPGAPAAKEKPAARPETAPASEPVATKPVRPDAPATKVAADPTRPMRKRGRPGAVADTATQTQPQTKGEPSATKNEMAKTESAPKSKNARSAPGEKSQAKAEPAKPEAPFVDVATELDQDRQPALKTGGDLFIKDVVILTGTARGTIPKGSILIEAGRFKAVGPDLAPPPGIKVFDAAGLVAMPGIIDTHSHIAVQGGVNEGTLSVVPEVRIKDVITGDDVAIYRALAGGMTAARILHGSANTIGGQDAVIKLKYGKPGRDLIIRDAPQGVKFALGENVTRSRGRFPNTRMGVQSVIERSFDQARAYRNRWNDYQRQRETRPPADLGPPPRVDLRLEALAGILDGSIRIHSHCYRSDEILMLLSTAERYGVRVRSLQHVLEGYKVAAEIAAHGASASTFSDWWAYKIEAYDAIPYNAALMTAAGVSVCIKSDDAELMRHLNLEAAKMVKYGGASEAQALAMVTMNPARELGLDGRMGSIEVGKDADVALWSGHPLDGFSRCQLTVVDGEVYFQRKEAPGLARRPGDHAAMPSAAQALRARTLDVAPQPKDLYALVGATLHPVSGPAVKGGTLVVAKGRIAAVGSAGTPIPPEAQTIDLAGLDVWPGMIDAGSTVGLFEVGSLAETQDFADSAQYQPELRSSVALHPDSEHIPVTRAAGVLASFVEPSGGVISGQGCVINLNGWTPRDLVVADAVALNIAIPTHIPRTPEGRRPGFLNAVVPLDRPGAPQGPGAGQAEAIRHREETLDHIKQLFHRALAYETVKAKAIARAEAPPAPDPRLEALAPYALGKKLVIFHAEHPVEILDAIAIARELKLKAAVSGAAGAWAVVDALKEARMPVLLGGTLRLPSHDHDPYDSSYATPARLHAAGVPFAIRSQHGGPSGGTASRNLPFEAATAVAFGLPEASALRAVTLAPAEILGVAGELGSLEPGKRANLVVTAGDLLQPTTPVVGLFIDGEPVAPESRHTRLYDKYRHRLDLVRSGRAQLGIERPATPISAGGRGTTTQAP